MGDAACVAASGAAVAAFAFVAGHRSFWSPSSRLVLVLVKHSPCRWYLSEAPALLVEQAYPGKSL